MRREVRWGIYGLLLLCLSLAALAAEPNIDLGEFSISDPKVIATYSAPVRITGATLIYQGQQGNQPYPLCAQPNPTTFNARYEFYPVQGGGTPGSCSTGKMEPLRPGKYALEISADDANSVPSQLSNPAVRTFTITGLEITLVAPKNGMGTSSTIPVTLRTHEMVDGKDIARSATCKWFAGAIKPEPTNFPLTFDSWNSFSTTGGSEHKTTYNGRGSMQVLCKETAGSAVRYTYGNFSFDFDASPPNFLNFSIRPSMVTDPGRKYAAISFQTDDNSSCVFGQLKPTATAAEPFPRDNSQDEDPKGPPSEDESVKVGYVSSHEIAISYESINDEQEHNYTYSIGCKNLAGLVANRTANVTVRIGGDVAITTPKATLINTSTFPLRVRTSFLAQGCSMSTGAGSPVTLEQDDDDPLNFSKELTLQDGDYTLTVTCTAAGKSPSASHPLKIDATAPTTPIIETNNTLCDGRIRARFIASDPKPKTAAGQEIASAVPTGITMFNYTVTDDSGWTVSGSTTTDRVELTPPATLSDHVTWTVFAVDAAGNEGTENVTTVADMHTGSDEECLGQSFITLLEPSPLGFSGSDISPYLFKVGTLRQATCRYQAAIDSDTWSGQISFSQTTGVTHSSNVAYTNKRVLVNCTESGRPRNHTEIFTIGRDPNPPIITISVLPSSNIFDRSSNQPTLTILTNKDTYCQIDGVRVGERPDTDPQAYQASHTTVLDFSQEPPGTKSLLVECKSLAQLWANKTQNFVIDYDQDITIDVLAPPEYTSAQSITLSVRPNKRSTCSWRYNETDAQHQFEDVTNGVHNTTLGAMSEGQQSLLVDCASIADGETGNRTVDFTVQRTAPTISKIEGPEILCANMTSVPYTVTVDGQMVSLEYNLSGTNLSINRTTQSDVITLSTEGLVLGAYRMLVVAINRVGLRSAPEPVAFEILNMTAAACRESQNGTTCENGEKDAGEDNIDCGGVCAKECVACLDSTDCETPEICRNNTCVAPATGCAADTDCPPGKSCESNQCVTKPACTTNEDCTGGKVCTNGACVIEAECAEHDECEEGFACALGYCVEPGSGEQCDTTADCPEGLSCFANLCIHPPVPINMCRDGVLDGDETALDCGGSCAACIQCTSSASCGGDPCIQNVCLNASVHRQCTTDSDCIGQRCTQGICTGITVDYCTDRVLDNGEEDIDCGGECEACVTCSEDNPCSDGKECGDNGKCVPSVRASCSDGIQNRDEEDVDCGGSICDPCDSGGGPGPGPRTPTEPDACENGEQDEDEEGVDCGGSCNTACPESHLLEIALIIVGLVIIGGAGYFLFEQNEAKKAAAAAAKARQAQYRPPQAGGMSALRPMNPELAAKYAQEQAAREAALRAEYQKREAEKQAQRKALFGAFDGEKPAGTGQAAGQLPADAKASAQSTPGAKPGDSAQKAQPAKSEAKSDANDGKGSGAKGDVKSTAGAKAGAKNDTGSKETPSDDVFEELENIGKR